MNEVKNWVWLIIIGALLGLGGVSVWGSISQSNNGTFEKKQNCSQYYDLANRKINESGRMFQGESYTRNEIFYSPQMDTCLYAYTIHTSDYELYSIYDFFGGAVFGGSIDTDFQIERIKLKR